MSTLYHNNLYIMVKALPMTVMDTMDEMINLGKHFKYIILLSLHQC